MIRFRWSRVGQSIVLCGPPGPRQSYNSVTDDNKTIVCPTGGCLPHQPDKVSVGRDSIVGSQEYQILHLRLGD